MKVAMISPLNDIYRQVGVSFYLDLWYTQSQSEYIWHTFGAPVGFFDTELELTPMQAE